MPVSVKTAAIGAGAAVVALLGLSWMMTRPAGPPDPFAQCRRGVSAGTGQIGGPFTLISETGATVTEKDVITQPSLVYFGYTYCPDICPIDSTRNAEASLILKERGYQVTPVFISVDSLRDTPAQLTEFTDLMSPDMIGLSGSEEQITAATKAYRAYYKVQTPGDPNTLIDHSTQTYLMFPEIGFVEFYNRDTTPEEMVKSVACFIDAAKSGQK